MIAVPKPPKREKKKPKRLKTRRDNIETELDDLWRDCIYLRAGFASEQSGIEATILDDKLYGVQAHHVMKKGNHWLRYSLDNGICILEQEHMDHHFEVTPTEFNSRMISLVGSNRWAKLMELKRDNTQPNLTSIREDLKFTRGILIEKLMNTEKTHLLNVYLKQIGLTI